MKFNTIKNFFWTLKNQRSIKNWRKRNFSPPSPEFIKHQIIKNNNLENCIWIETGTYYGETTSLLATISKKTVSIEADEKLYNLVKKKLNHLSNVEILFGKSEEMLSNAIKSNINFENICQKVDLITVNHALCEMSNHSVRHLLSVANKIGNPKFFMESYGSFRYSHKRSDIRPLFREFGYKETYNTESSDKESKLYEVIVKQ